jgi:hypothetical protein
VSGSRSASSPCSIKGMWKKARAFGLRSATSVVLLACRANLACRGRSRRLQIPPRSSAPSGTNGRWIGLTAADVLKYHSTCDSCKRNIVTHHQQRAPCQTGRSQPVTHADVIVLERRKGVPRRGVLDVVARVEDVDAGEVHLGSGGREGVVSRLSLISPLEERPKTHASCEKIFRRKLPMPSTDRGPARQSEKGIVASAAICSVLLVPSCAS